MSVPALKALRVDVSGYFDPGWGFRRKFRRALAKPEIWVICAFRIGSWIHRECPVVLRPFFKFFWKPWYTFVSTLYDTHLSPYGEIGPGLHFSHAGGIWVNSMARLGAHCHLGQGSVIGSAGAGALTSGAPVLGDRVWVGPHAVITGNVTVGSGAVIGANSLVVSSVPENGNVVGVPARLIARFGSGRLIRVTGDAAATDLQDSEPLVYTRSDAERAEDRRGPPRLSRGEDARTNVS